MWINKLTTPASDPGSAGLVLRLTVLILLLRPMGPWWIGPLLLAIAVLALVFPRVLFAPGTWFGLAFLTVARILQDWPLADNHIYLLAYWCLAIGLALGSCNAISALGRSSRLLIGLAFLFAVMWKVVLSPDYLDGRFFRATYLTDPRFENVTGFVGGLTNDQLAESREYMRPLPEGSVRAEVPRLHDTPSFTALVFFSTWVTVVLEALCAIFFLIPLRDRSSTVAHVLLLLFCVTTYAVAPVAGFGWLLLTMGLASVSPEHRSLRTAYVIGWLLVLAYFVTLWAGFFLDRLGHQWFGTGT
jgi:hypothetical protein